jgi:hypothetical protein
MPLARALGGAHKARGMYTSTHAARPLRCSTRPSSRHKEWRAATHSCRGGRGMSVVLCSVLAIASGPGRCQKQGGSWHALASFSPGQASTTRHCTAAVRKTARSTGPTECRGAHPRRGACDKGSAASTCGTRVKRLRGTQARAQRTAVGRHHPATARGYKSQARARTHTHAHTHTVVTHVRAAHMRTRYPTLHTPMYPRPATIHTQPPTPNTTQKPPGPNCRPPPPPPPPPSPVTAPT